MKKLTQFAVAAGVLAVASTLMAQPKPENLVKHRQSAMTLIGWYFGPLGAVAKGEKPFNKDDAVRATGYLVTLSKMPWEGFVPGTDGVGNTKALPAIQKHAADFKYLGEQMQTELVKLAAFANAGDEAGFKKQFGVVGGACKHCHDDFKAK